MNNNDIIELILKILITITNELTNTKELTIAITDK